MIPPGVAERLQAHAAAVVSAASVPASEREELTEELYGHLLERCHALVDAGMDPKLAADRAIADFGSPDRIGPDLTCTYRGRLWASTIGVLLPTVAGEDAEPRTVWWLAVSLRWYGVFGALAVAATLAGLSPGRAFITLAVAVPYLSLLFIGAVALGRRQQWARDFAIAVNVMGVLVGVITLFGQPWTFSLSAIGSVVILLRVMDRRDEVDRWVRPSRSVTGPLAIAIVILAMIGPLTPIYANQLPDPTQAGPDDLHIDLALECAPRSVSLEAEIRWDRTSFLPGGIGGWQQYGDLLVLDLGDEETWTLENYPVLRDSETGAVAAEPGEALAPNQERSLQVIRGSFAIQVPWNALAPGRTYVTDWELRLRDDIPVPEIFATTVEYIHTDAFRWEALANCDSGVGEPFISDWP